MVMTSRATRSGRLRPTPILPAARTIKMRHTDTVSSARIGRGKVERNRMVRLWLTACVFASLGIAIRAEAQTAPAPYLTAYRYVDGGLLAGTISAAPSEQSNFLATRNTYDANGRLQKAESGLLASWPA